MANFRNYQFNQSEVTAIAIDTYGGQFLWIAFTQKDGTCRLQKVSAHDLTQVYFTLELEVDSINCMKVLDQLIYIGVTHATDAVYAYYISAPLSYVSIFTKSELSLTESPIAVTSTATYVYFLTPGSESGNEAQIVNFDNAGSTVETINLTESGLLVSNAVSVTIDASDNLWVVTSSNPAELYRVFYESSTWQLQQTILD